MLLLEKYLRFHNKSCVWCQMKCVMRFTIRVRRESIKLIRKKFSISFITLNQQLAIKRRYYHCQRFCQNILLVKTTLSTKRSIIITVCTLVVGNDFEKTFIDKFICTRVMWWHYDKSIKVISQYTVQPRKKKLTT